MSSENTPVTTRLIKPLYNTLLRPHLPETYLSANGIAVPGGRFFDRTTDIDYKPVARRALTAHLDAGDHVVEIATGHGIFGLVCHREGATVDTYEADAETLDRARELHQLVGADDSITHHHALVGAAGHGLGETDAPALAVSDLPDRDVLLLDCEGAEKAILSESDHRADRVLVESHPNQGAPATALQSILEDSGYQVVQTPMREDTPEKAFLVATHKEDLSEDE
jgi:hypothetical protein